MSTTLVAPRPRANTSPSAVTLGFWSAVLATVFSLSYVVAQLLEWTGALGSAGGPASGSTVVGLIVLLTPSFFLGSSFLVLMVSVHCLRSEERRVGKECRSR